MLAVLRYTDSDYPFGIFKLFFHGSIFNITVYYNAKLIITVATRLISCFHFCTL